MAVYRVMLLPSKDDLTLLQDIKDFLYTNGYRYSRDPSNSLVHITLDQLHVSNTVDFGRYLQDFSRYLADISAFPLAYYEITQKIYTDTDSPSLRAMYPKGRGRVALLFSNTHTPLGYISTNSIYLSQKYSIDGVASYINNIRSLYDFQSDSKLDYIANHMNICNYALPSKTEKACEFVRGQAPAAICFDTVVIQSLDGPVIARFLLK